MNSEETVVDAGDMSGRRRQQQASPAEYFQQALTLGDRMLRSKLRLILFGLPFVFVIFLTLTLTARLTADSDTTRNVIAPPPPSMAVDNEPVKQVDQVPKLELSVDKSVDTVAPDVKEVSGDIDSTLPADGDQMRQQIEAPKPPIMMLNESVKHATRTTTATQAELNDADDTDIVSMDERKDNGTRSYKITTVQGRSRLVSVRKDSDYHTRDVLDALAAHKQVTPKSVVNDELPIQRNGSVVITTNDVSENVTSDKSPSNAMQQTGEIVNQEKQQLDDDSTQSFSGNRTKQESDTTDSRLSHNANSTGGHGVIKNETRVLLEQNMNVPANNRVHYDADKPQESSSTKGISADLADDNNAADAVSGNQPNVNSATTIAGGKKGDTDDI